MFDYNRNIFDLDRFTQGEPADLTTLKKKRSEIGFDMGCHDCVGQILRLLVSTKLSGKFLEIGTGVGMGAAWILDGMHGESCELISLDTDAGALKIARDVLGYHSNVRFIQEGYETFLTKQKPESFDIIFADAYPGKYILVEETLKLLKPGGLYVVDDIIPQESWPEEHYELASSMIDGLLNVRDVIRVGLKTGTGVVLFTRK